MKSQINITKATHFHHIENVNAEVGEMFFQIWILHHVVLLVTEHVRFPILRYRSELHGQRILCAENNPQIYVRRETNELQYNSLVSR